MSSDSEEDIFGNAAKKLKTLCSKTSEQKYDNCEIVSDSTDTDGILSGVCSSTSFKSLTTLNSDDIEIGKRVNPTKKPDYPSDLSNESDNEWFETHRKDNKERRTNTKCRKSRRIASKKSGKVTNKSKSNTDSTILENVANGNITNICDNLSQSVDIIDTLVRPVRGSSGGSRRRGCRNRGRGRRQATPQYPTYNIGDIEEYPDKSEDIPLFSSKPIIPTITNEIVISDEDPVENEELSIHVHWQNYKVFKFNIRKYQKLKAIFDFFSKKENVPEKRLFFAYNDVVLTCDDTPDSMKYNIAKFIEGGIISQDIINLVAEHSSTKSNGIQIKFQCQNFKKPYEISIQPNDKLSLAMVKCAEHFEKSLDTLRFEFDGECISGTATAKELELENGDCIDIRISK